MGFTTKIVYNPESGHTCCEIYDLSSQSYSVPFINIHHAQKFEQKINDCITDHDALVQVTCLIHNEIPNPVVPELILAHEEPNHKVAHITVLKDGKILVSVYGLFGIDYQKVYDDMSHANYVIASYNKLNDNYDRRTFLLNGFESEFSSLVSPHGYKYSYHNVDLVKPTPPMTDNKIVVQAALADNSLAKKIRDLKPLDGPPQFVQGANAMLKYIKTLIEPGDEVKSDLVPKKIGTNLFSDTAFYEAISDKTKTTEFPTEPMPIKYIKTPPSTLQPHLDAYIAKVIEDKKLKLDPTVTVAKPVSTHTQTNSLQIVEVGPLEKSMKHMVGKPYYDGFIDEYNVIDSETVDFYKESILSKIKNAFQIPNPKPITYVSEATLKEIILKKPK